MWQIERDLIIQASGSNPGCLRVLFELKNSQNFKESLVPLLNSLLLSETHPMAVWQCYKDLCGEDLKRTWEYLQNWYMSDTSPLEKYMRKDLKKRGK